MRRRRIRKYEKVIDADNAPPRLKGKVIALTVDEVRDKMEFRTDVPEDVTPQETGYLRWYIGEFVDSLKAKLPSITFGEQKAFLDKEASS